MKILMVCLGNICRSPIAEGVLRKKIEENDLDIHVESAGTGSWHVGESPDRRAVQTAHQYGVDISSLRGRHFSVTDFDEFDRIYVMDKFNFSDVLSQTRNEDDKKKVALLLNSDKPESNRSVPDPYYGEEDGFHSVYKMIDVACDAIVADLKMSAL